MSFPTVHVPNLQIIAGSIDTDGTILAGAGFQVAAAGRTYTITLDREYDGLVSATCSLLNATPVADEAISAVIKSHSVVADTAGGNVVIHLVSDAAAIDTDTLATEVHFCLILLEDSSEE